MMTYSVGSSDSYRVCAMPRVYECSMRKILQAAVHSHTNFQRCALRVLASFSCPGEGHNVPVSYVKEELRFRCELEPSNARNANSIHLKCPSTSRGRLQLTLLLSGFHAEG